MEIGSAIAVYFLIWWVTLFAVLPWGIRDANEAGETLVAGQAPSAPVKPSMKRKLLWNTLVSALLFGLYLLNLRMGWIGLADLFNLLGGPDIG